MKYSENDKTMFVWALTMVVSLGAIALVGGLFPLLLEMIF